MNKILAVALLASVPFSAAHAHDTPAGIGAEVRQELATARKEVRLELAKAKRDLDTAPLTLGDNFSFGKHYKADPRLPRAEITAQGDFLIEGKAQTVDAGQRRQLLAYRGQVIGIAKTGIDLGQRSADAALEAIGDSSLVGLVFSAMTGSLERRVERVVKQEIEPGVRGICRQLPALMVSQQRLASSLAPFRPYATLEADDVDNCEAQVRNEFAIR
jgi:hypothetical protein